MFNLLSRLFFSSHSQSIQSRDSTSSNDPESSNLTYSTPCPELLIVVRQEYSINARVGQFDRILSPIIMIFVTRSNHLRSQSRKRIYSYVPLILYGNIPVPRAKITEVSRVTETRARSVTFAQWGDHSS